MDREDYIFEANRQLNNQEHYRKLDAPIYLDSAQEINTIIQTLTDHKIITRKQAHYLKGADTPRARIFYMLPKIHKSPETWTIPHTIPPGRPIVSDCNSESYRIAEYIDHFLNPLSTKHTSYLKDTYDFIDKIKTLKLPETAFLFTIDIDSLYTNIETNTGIAAIRKCLNLNPDPTRPDEELIKLLEISLTKNDFEFDNQFYLQTKGTAMGKRFAPSYANIYMADWEETILPRCPHRPTHYFRYLDDIWGTWTHSMEEFTHFISLLNTHHQSIKVKYTTHNSKVNFLDTTTYKGPHFSQTHQLDTKVYFKETDTHTLLHKTSYHPKHTFRGLIKSQLLRFHRICTQHTDFQAATKVLFTALRQRGYSRSFLRGVRKTFLEQKPRDNKKIIPLITTYSHFSVAANSQIKQNLTNKLQDTNLLTGHKIISAYRKNKNLTNYLVSSKLPSLNRKPTKTSRHFKQLSSLRSQSTGITYNIPQTFTQNSRNCIYAIQCDTCKIIYIGETGNTIRVRLTQHIYNIKHKKESQTPLVAHFLQHNLESLKITGLERNQNWTIGERKWREKDWINKLQTTFPLGLNIRISTIDLD
ncbi:uncharacterized protein LOC131708063 [Acipenser ruthenus]|uniref:uncharacterized protein LOC131708063 n=1 Tax=Acipenser ruthenus TaxID=7906 RepID=UPI0027413868|nr:uncharacterized protein LOC131708063 [Acipenser ruthenus]XP_058865982.1 uncharacterized protein LOC131708063 [Acipenser ruthenus]XP_058865983.1 uncharacterized protein LOC131708063 [Acipenser ruthenus]XP_058865984.1 uncharacterized protein LOC131708063 [Acipenser ruthenus]